MATVPLLKIVVIQTRDGNGPGGPRAGPGLKIQARGPKRAKTGLKLFYLIVLCATENSNFC